MSTNVIHLAALEVGLALAPVRDALDSPEAFQAFMLELGWSVKDIPPAILALGTSADRLQTALVPIVEGEGSTSQFLELIQSIRALIDAIDGLGSANFDPALAAAGFATAFPKQLIEHLVIRHLVTQRPRVAFLLTALGVIRATYVEAPTPDHHDHVRRELVWADFPGLLTDPVQLLENAFGWRTEHLAHDVLLRAAVNLALTSGLQASLEELDEDIIVLLENQEPPPGQPKRLCANLTLFQKMSDSGELAAGLKVLGLRKDGAELPGFALLPYLTGQLSEDFPVDARTSITVESTLDLAGGVGIILRPSTGLRLMNGLADPATSAVTEGSVLARIVNTDRSGEPTIVIGSEDGSRFEYQALSANVGLTLTSGLEADLFAELQLEGGKLLVKPGQADSFLKAILPDDGITAEIAITAGMSQRRGFYLRGSGGLEVEIPVHRTLGPIELRSATIGLRPSARTIPLSASATFTCRLGPITVVAEDMGITATFSFPEDNRGLLGPVDIGVGFKTPDALGIAVDAGPISGGGFLRWDEPNGRYFGVLELEVYDVSVKAIGLLDTRLPGGRPEYSFLIIITSEFTPIQLGFGFTLNGVGGLAGIHRRVETDVLRLRIQDGTLDRILFAKDPVANAPAIATDLQAVFPPAPNQYVFGPMARIGWGPRTLIEAKVGILLEIPEPARILILAQIHAALPRPDKALIELNIDVLGEIDLDRKRIAVDGRLRNSRVLSFPLEGEMAMRMQGGDSPNFALAIGGFHPDYIPPPGFPKLKRVSIAIGIDGNPRITLEGYLALTSNTLQLGAAASLYASKGWFNISGEIKFNALFAFSPFSFITDFSGKVALRKGTTDLAAISLSAKLSGPTPWRASGEACLEIRWLPDICVGFSATFGREERVELPQIDPWPELQKAVENPESWAGARPTGTFRGATLGTPATASGTLLDPAFGVTLRQTVLPLHRQITRFGASAPPGGSDRFDVQHIASGTNGIDDWTPVDDFFAPAQFEDMSDDQKLSRPSFERMDAGVTFAGDRVDHGTAIGMDVEYDTKIIDSTFVVRRGPKHFPVREWQLALAARGSSARSPLVSTGRKKFASAIGAAPLVRLQKERYVVASTIDLSTRADVTAPASKGAVYQALERYLAAHPNERGLLEVMAVSELPVEP
jgi:hypothetical protein